MIVPRDYLENPIFDHLSDHEKSVLNSNASLMQFDQEEMFIKNESLLFSVFYIYKGEVKIKDEKSHLIDLYGETDFIGLRYLFNENPVFFLNLWRERDADYSIRKKCFQKICHNQC